MKILFIAPYLPSSLRIRPYRLIRHLSKNHKITFVGIVQPAWTSCFIEDLQALCEEVYPIDLNRYTSIFKSLLAIPSRSPMSVSYFSSSKMKSLVANLVRESNFDLIHTEFIRAAPYTINIDGKPKLFDAVDSLTLAYERGWRNPYSGLLNRIVAYEEWVKMRNFEPKMVGSFDRVIVSSPIDQQYLSSRIGPTVDVIQNGVDQEYYFEEKNNRDKNLLVFIGQMNYYVNVDSVLYFCNHIFPAIQKQKPGVKLAIVGADPKKSIHALTKNTAIEVTGYVTDIRPYLSRASVFVCPMVSGSGIQNKLLHSMAMGTPVVTTSLAIQALQVKDKEHVIVADDPQKFADAVCMLLADNNLQKQISSNALEYVQMHHNWNSIGQRLEEIYFSMV